MNAPMQDTLLYLFQQVIDAPESMPPVPNDAWLEGSEEQRLLARFRDLLERIQQSRQQAERQLREREEQYRSIFEETSDGLVVFDMDGFIVEANPAACSVYGCTYEELVGLHSSVLTHPDYLPLMADALQTIQSGDQFQKPAIALRKDGTPFYGEGHATPFTYKGKPHMLVAVRDVTERIESERQLREREQQYRSVFEATYDGLIISDTDGYIVEVNPAFCGMYSYSREELIGVHSSALAAPEYLPALDEVLETLKAGRNYQTVVAQSLRKDGTRFYTESHGTSLIYRGKPHALGVVRDITEQVQAQQLLEQRVVERTRELSSLLEISHMVASTLQLKPLVGLILDQLKTVVDYTGASILTVEGGELVFLDSRSPTPEEQLMRLRLSPQRLGSIWKAITSRESILLPDVRDESPLAQALYEAMGELMDTTFRYVRTCLFVPLTLKDRVIGMLVLTASEANAFTPHHATLALAIANQAAIAIENAQLYAQAQELAALEERQKLARELHDSVSQALYGISLGTHAARIALTRDPDHVAEPLDYVLSLAEAGLAEMRALIFELRPESLETEGLVAALTKQAAAVQARHGITVLLDLCDEPGLPLRVKQDLYRIAQEAMHNTVKHAHASQIDLCLSQTPEALFLEVRDDGVGFDAMASFPGHLGLRSMQERVALLGGTIEIESTPGAGTRLRIRISGTA